jgi:SAM-dependent methyltransferase
MGYASPVPAQAQFDDYYQRLSKYVAPASGTGNGILPWDDDRLSELAVLLSQRVAVAGAHVVDIGCTGGGLLRHLASAGYSRVTGVDPAPASVAMARAQPHPTGVLLEAHLGWLTSLPAEAAGADLYVLSHVLEHVRDVGPALDAIGRVCLPTTTLYVEVPDAMQFVNYLESPFLEFNTEHINYFSVESLAACVRRRGWDVIESGQRVITSGETSKYPCAWVYARPSAAAGVAVNRVDDTLIGALAEYTAACSLRLEGVSARCLQLVQSAAEVVVWGTGQTTSILLANSQLGNANIIAFTDNDERFVGYSIRGRPVVAPDALHVMPSTPIVVGSFLHEEAIVRSIRARGLVNPIISLKPAP